MNSITSREIAFCSVLYAVAQFFFLIFVSRFYGVDSLAAYSLLSGFLAPVLSMLSAGQRFNILVEKKSLDLFFDAVIVRLFICFVFCVICFIYLFIFNDGALVFFSIAFFLYKIPEALLELFLWKFQLESRYRIFMITGGVRAVALPVVSAIVYFLGFDVAFIFLFCSVLYLIFVFYVFAFEYNFKVLSFNKFRLVEHLSSSFVPGVAAGLESFSIVLPRFVLATTGGPSSVAIYTIVTQVVAALGMVGSAIIQSSMPKFSIVGLDFKSFIVFVRKITGISLLGLVVLFIVPESLFVYLFGDWFRQGMKDIFYFVPFLFFFSYIGSYVINSAAAFYGKRMYLVYYSSGFLFCFAVLMFVLAYAFGLDVLGVSWLVVISYIARFLIVFVLFFVVKVGYEK